MTFYKFMVILFTFKVIVSFYPYVYLTPVSPIFVPGHIHSSSLCIIPSTVQYI